MGSGPYILGSNWEGEGGVGRDSSYYCVRLVVSTQSSVKLTMYGIAEYAPCTRANQCAAVSFVPSTSNLHILLMLPWHRSY